MFAAICITVQTTPAFVLPAKLNTIPYATSADRIAFLYDALGNPGLLIFYKALDIDFLLLWPKVTSKLVRKYPHYSVVMVQGHLGHVTHNAQLIKPIPLAEKQLTTTKNPAANKPPPPFSLPGKRTNDIYAVFVSATGNIFIDQTGRFHHTSTAGNKYMLVVYDYNINFVYFKAMPSRSDYQIMLAYQRAHAIMVARSLHP